MNKLNETKHLKIRKMNTLRSLITFLVRIPNIPFQIILTVIVIHKAKKGRDYKSFLAEGINLEGQARADIMDLIAKYTSLYYPNGARYIIAITFYATLLIWLF